MEWYLQGEECKRQRQHVVERKVLFAETPKAVFAVSCEEEATSKPHRTIVSNNSDLPKTVEGEAEEEGQPGATTLTRLGIRMCPSAMCRTSRTLRARFVAVRVVVSGMITVLWEGE